MIRLAGALAAVLMLALPDVARADFTVTTTNDGSDGTCDTTNCTLREALQFVPAGQIVHLPAGLYNVSTALDATTSVTVVGAGARVTTIKHVGGIDGGTLDRVLTVQSETDLSLSGVTVTGGNDDLIPGGGIAVLDAASLHLSDSTVTGNLADRGGGIYTEGVLDVKRSLIADNRADGEETTPVGGGIEIDNIGSAALENTTVAKNIARNGPGDDGQGGGIYTSANLDLHNVTIAENEAAPPGVGSNGGGLFQNFGVSTTLRTLATNTLVARNVGRNCGGTADPHAIQATNGLSDELAQPSCNAPGSTNVLVADTRLGSLADNGGPTDTMALLDGSPGIDAGASCPAADQRGVARPQGARCDIGAYEAAAAQSSQPPGQEEQPLPAPVAGKSVNALPKSGTVKIKLPGTNTFVTLSEGEQIPVGTTVDTRKGRVTLVAAANKSGGTATSDFYDGLFKVTQTKGKKPITVLALIEKLTCGASGKKATVAKKKVRKRRLWGDGKGHFRTEGKHSAATVVGTKWLVQDTCSTTLTKVVRGKVSVRDFVKRKTVIVRKGHKYVARAKR
jgi:CSLREA domain-containing protein